MDNYRFIFLAAILPVILLFGVSHALSNPPDNRVREVKRVGRVRESGLGMTQ